MQQIDFTHHPFMDSFCEFEIGGLQVDLHNYFKCTSVQFLRQLNELKLNFVASTASNLIKEVVIIFDDITIDLLDFQPTNEYQGLWTIDMMYPGRFINDDGILAEDLAGRNFYYINFYEDYTIELFAKSVLAEVVKG